MVGVGSGMFNSPNTAAMMGTVPTYRRGIAAGARTMLQNTGAVISIAFVLAIVTSSVDKDTLFAIFSGVTTGLSDATLDPFVANMHTALWVLAATSRGRRLHLPAAAEGGLSRCGSASWRARRGRRRGPCATTRRSGCCRSPRRARRASHREYGDEDLARLRELLRLKHMLGLSLDELRDVMHGEDARAQRRRE